MNARDLLRRFAPSLLTRVVLALALVGLVPVGLLASRLIGVNRAAMTDQVENTHALTARKTADAVAASVEARRALVESLAANPALADPRSSAAQVLLGQNLQAWAAQGALALAVVNRQGERVVLAQLSDDAARAKVQEAFDRPAERELATYGLGDELVVRLSAELSGGGALWLIYDGSPLTEALEAFELGEAAELALTDADGNVLLGSLENFSPQLLEQARSRWIQGVDPRFRVGEGGEEFIGAFAPVPATDWTIFSRQPARVARAAEMRMRRQTQVALLLSGAAVLLLSFAGYWTVVRPIRQLAAAQRRLAGLGGAARGGSEIGQLKSAFDALRKGLEERKALDEVFLGRYQVVEPVGAGAMGNVFRGWDPKLRRPVALKTIRLDRTVSPARREELIERLLDEAIMVAQFNHPNIVAVFDIEDHVDAAFVAMEYVDGMSLEQYLAIHGRLSEELALPLGAAIAEALAAAHAHGTVHRDIKPANILLGRDQSIKVADFGISELLTTMSAEPDVVFGTPGYIPPETLQGQPGGASADLFSLGSLLYVCVTGRLPFAGQTVKEVVRHTISGAIKPPRELAPISPELEAVILELLEREPEKRPQDSAEVARRLRELAQQRGAEWHLDLGELPPAPERRPSVGARMVSTRGMAPRPRA